METIDKLDQIYIGKKGAAPIAAPGWAGVAGRARQAGRLRRASQLSASRKTSCPTCPSSIRNILLDQGLHLPGSGYANMRLIAGMRPDLKDPELQERENSTSRSNSRRKNCSTAGNIDFRPAHGTAAPSIRLRRLARSRLGRRPLRRVSTTTPSSTGWSKDPRIVNSPSWSRPMTRRWRSRRFIAWRPAKTPSPS